MGLNDWADRDRDRLIAPDRPLPSGALSPGPALVVVLLLGAAAVLLGGGPAGARGTVLTALAATALYDLSLKSRPFPGAVALGLSRAANAAVGVLPLVAAGVAPAWTLLGPAAVGVYAAGITVLSTTEDHPSRERTWSARMLAAAAYVGACVLAGWAAGRLTWAVVLVAGSVLSLAFGRVPRPGPVKRQVLEMLLGLYLLAATLAGGAGTHLVEFAAIGAAFLFIALSQVAVRALRPR
jgi:hypothetical protein